MSWDIFVQDFPPDAASFADVPAEFRRKSIGTRSSIIKKIREVIPFANFADPAWGVIDREGWSIEVNLGDNEDCDGFALHVRGSDLAVDAVMAILQHLNLRALDSRTGTFLTARGDGLDSFREWRAYRDAVANSEDREQSPGDHDVQLNPPRLMPSVAMALLKWVRRLICLVVGLVLLALLAVQMQQRLLRWRAERLLADMQQIRLYQSTWADAQRLMKRWGAWGYYEGSCTAESCSYRIRITDLSFSATPFVGHAWVDWLLLHDKYNLYLWFGGRGAVAYASFTVHDGTIWRKGTGLGVVVSTRQKRRDDDWDKTLYLTAESRQRLHQTIEDPFVTLGSDDQLALHPYYKAGRPDGCKINCQFASVSYSTRTPPAEIARLTAYHFDCFTRFTPCAELEDVLPAAGEWHLYDDYHAPSTPVKANPSQTKACDIPVWALARDARYILSVEALAGKKLGEDGVDPEVSNVKILASLKAPAPWLPGETGPAYPYPGDPYLPSPQQAEHLIPGRRYLVFPIGDDRRDQRVAKTSPIRLNRCGVQDDNPETRGEVAKGIAQNDALNP